jgi:hypothetical protein
VAISLSRLDVGPDIDPNTTDPKLRLTTVTYLGPDLTPTDANPIPDKPPTALPCTNVKKLQPDNPANDKTDAGKLGPEANQLNDSIKLQILGNQTRPTAHPNPRQITHPGGDQGDEFIAFETCVFSQSEGAWVRTDVKQGINNKGPNVVNYGEGTLHVGTTAPSDAAGLKKGEYSKDPTSCLDKPPGTPATQVFPFTTVSRTRTATTDHIDVYPGITLDPDGDADGPHVQPGNPKSKLQPELPDGDTLADDWDGDGCPDWDELDMNHLNGLDPFNPNDCNTDDFTGVYNILVTAIPASPGTNNTPNAGGYFHCISRVEHDTGTNALDSTLLCYTDSPGLGDPYSNYINNTDGLAGAPPPPPYGLGDHTNIGGSVAKADANYTLTNNAAFTANNVMIWFTPQASVKSASAEVIGPIPNDCLRQVHKVFPVQENSPNGPAADRVTLNFSRDAVGGGPGSGTNKCVAPGQQIIVHVTYNGAPPALEHVRWVNPSGPQLFDEKPAVVPQAKPGNNLLFEGCFEDVNGTIGPAVYTRSVIDGAKLNGTVEIYLAQAPSNCLAGTPSGAPLLGKIELARQKDDFDHDRDGCTDAEELAKPPAVKVGHDPMNPFDCPANPAVSTSATGIYSALATRQAQIRCKNQLPAPQCTGQADGTVVPGVYFHCRIALTDPGPLGAQRNVTIRPFCYSDSTGINTNNHVMGTTGDGLGGNPPPSAATGFAEVHGSQTSATAKISAANLLTFPTGICFDNPHSQLGRVYVVGSVDLNANPVAGTIDIYIAQPNAACAGSPIGAPFAAAVPLQLARQSADLLVDFDGDNCTDSQELGNAGASGGLRDPYNWGDFMSVHTGPAANLQKDKVVSVADISATVARFGANDAGATTKINRNTNPKTQPIGTIYYPTYDRGGPIPNGGAAGAISRQLPANAGSGAGSVTVADISAVVAQFGSSCV